jgi:alpha-beta hydrolase superfamily lysophospholipase
MQKSTVVILLKRAALTLLAVLVTFLGIRAWDSQRGEPLEPWHTVVPHELHADELDGADWAAYMAAENAAFEEVRREVTERLPEHDRVPFNRYFADSPIYPGHFQRDWNRSYVLQPEGHPAGAAVLLHGLTDSPYSLRNVARSYQARGWAVVAIRLPGHGTVPAGLTDADWEDWVAATRLAVREARRLSGPSVPLHMVGFSNGGALALKHALDALDDPALARPSRLVLISPMIGVTSLARFAGVLGWPAVFPAFAKAAWLGIVPEFNPFKFNSFPVHAARQSSQLTRVLQRQIAQHARDGRIAELPPVQTFQSVLDFTVSTSAILDSLYKFLPANGSELILFDLNHNAYLGPLLRPGKGVLANRLLPAPPRKFRTVIIGNSGGATLEVREEATEAGSAEPRSRALGLRYPKDVYSLSHVALPFPSNDPLYGTEPDASENFGVQLGAMAARGERAVLVVSLDALIRMSSNPFYPYMMERIEAAIPAEQAAATPESSHRPVQP